MMILTGGVTTMFKQSFLFALVAGSALDLSFAARKIGDAWVDLFNGKDTAGWKLRAEKISVIKFMDAEGKELAGVKKGKLEQKNIVVDAKGTEIKGAKAIQETIANPSGWIVENGALICAKPHAGNDLLTEKSFTDFELHVEFQATSNSGVYLQGRYEIQIIDSFGVKPKLLEKDGTKVEMLDTHQCGAIYGRIAPSKNMAMKPQEWQTYDVVFRGAGGPRRRSRKRRALR